MKVWLYKQIFFCALLTLLLIAPMAIGEDPSFNPIKIDRHWIYFFQQADLKTFEINEYFYINNTGETTFNDSLHIWIQNNSNIAADCCNGTPNMACRYNVGGFMECFYLNKLDNDNLYVGNPILSENRLSYFGQRELLSITVFSTTNASMDNDTLYLNATIGGSSIPREKERFQGMGVHLTSENLDVGMLPVIDLYMPFYITTIENITLLNNGTDTEIISFSFSDLPQGWSTEIWNNTEKLNNVSLSPQQYANLTLIITAPSNIASIHVRYTTQTGTDSNETKGLFTKKYLYATKKVTYEAYLLTINELEISNDLEMVHDELFWLESYDRFWFYAKNEDVQPNSYTTISMKLEKIADDHSNPYIIWIPVFIVILIIVILLLKKIDFFKEKDTLPKKDTFPEKKKEKLLEEKRIKELEEQKTKVLLSIKRVEREFKDEIINKEDYERFRAAYKKRAVEILKEIDRLKE